MSLMNKNILIAIDGSACSYMALVYAADLFKNDQDVNFHLLNCTSHSSTSIIESLDTNNTLFPEDPESGTIKEKANTYLTQAVRKLELQGIDTDRISLSTAPSQNIAYTITREAEIRIVDSILISRRGLGFVGEMLFGSVSASLFQKCHSTPLWIIDGEIKDNNFLISVDGTPTSMLAVEHLSHIFANREDIHFFLFHCHRFLTPDVHCSLEPFYKNWDKTWVDRHLSGKGCLFNGPIQLLLEANIPQNMITVLPESTNVEESLSIISHARNNKCGTIVMGRRKAGMAKGIFGEVASRTILQTQNMALWLIG